MSNHWFRLYAEFAHDPKVQLMSEHDQRRLIMLFCIRCNGDVTLQDKHVTFQLRISPQEWSASKALFIESGFIDANNNVLNWDKRQYISDSSATRVARHRALHKTTANVTVTTSNVTVTPPEQIQNRTDTEQIQKQNKSKVKNITPSALLAARDIDIQIANDWITLRKQKKAAITETALAGIEREAEKAGMSLQDALKVCCERGWASFKAQWMSGIANAGRNKRDPNAGIDVDAARREFVNGGDFIEGESKHVRP